MDRWAELFASMEYKRVAQHWVRGWMISTVWLGLDHNFGWGDCPPLIFETMIFAPGDATDDERSRCDERQDRYGSEKAALDGHWRAVDWLCKQLGYSRADLTAPVDAEERWDASLEELLGDA